MKNLFILLFLSIPFLHFGQTELETLMSEGVALHDAGEYDEAIAKYTEALKIDKKSSLVNYELGYTFFAKKEYKKALKPLDRVIKNKDKYLKEAYVVKGSCLDLLGKPTEAIKVYENAIAEFPENYLLHYNLALTQFNNKDAQGAEENLIAALTLNSGHPTSNYLLGIININKDERVKALMAIHFFLLLEPNSNRSVDAINMIKGLMREGVSRQDDKNVTINLNEFTLEKEFSAANTMLSLMAAANLTEENEEKSSQELFFENTESFISVLGKNEEGKTGIWYDLYVDFFADLLDSGNTEAYCYYITQSNGAIEKQWMEDNKEKMDKFFQWANE